MHSSREDQPGNAAGHFQTNVYTKKRRKLKIGRKPGGERSCRRAGRRACRTGALGGFSVWFAAKL